MRAKRGDRIVVEPGGTGGPRVGLIVGLQGGDGAPPYRVRWIDNDHEGVYFPGPNSRIEQRAEQSKVLVLAA